MLTASEMELRRKPDGEGSSLRRIGGIRTRNQLFVAVALYCLSTKYLRPHCRKNGRP